MLTKFSLLIPQEVYREKCGESTYWSVLGRNGSRVLGAPSPLNLLFLCFAHSDLMNQVAIRQLVLWRKMPFQSLFRGKLYRSVSLTWKMLYLHISKRVKKLRECNKYLFSCFTTQCWSLFVLNVCLRRKVRLFEVF